MEMILDIRENRGYWSLFLLRRPLPSAPIFLMLIILTITNLGPLCPPLIILTIGSMRATLSILMARSAVTRRGRSIVLFSFFSQFLLISVNWPVHEQSGATGSA